MKQADRELQRWKRSDGSIMSRVPNFASIDFAAVTPTASPAGASWLTPEGIAVKPVYAPNDVEGLDFLGLVLDPVRNDAHAAVITRDDSRVTGRVIRTDEESEIARSAREVRSGLS